MRSTGFLTSRVSDLFATAQSGWVLEGCNDIITALKQGTRSLVGSQTAINFDRGLFKRPTFMFEAVRGPWLTDRKRQYSVFAGIWPLSVSTRVETYVQQ